MREPFLSVPCQKTNAKQPNGKINRPIDQKFSEAYQRLLVVMEQQPDLEQQAADREGNANSEKSNDKQKHGTWVQLPSMPIGRVLSFVGRELLA
jgi:hypothetical protein